jgi:hypothetical protein
MSAKTHHKYNQLEVYRCLSSYPLSAADIVGRMDSQLQISIYSVKIALGILENLGKIKRHCAGKEVMYSRSEPRENIVREDYKGEPRPFRYVPRPPSDIYINRAFRKPVEPYINPANIEDKGE